MLFISRKPKKSASYLVKDMKVRGIDFEDYTDKEAITYLNEKNYYMKFAAYRKNYQKFNEGLKKGQYRNLKFKYLVELSTIDMHLRYLILKMCLDIEHSLCIRLLNLIEENTQEDGYRIIDEYKTKYPKQYHDMIGRLNRMRSTSVAHDLISKHHPDYPIWILIELISFGELLKFCSLYEELYNESVYDRKILNNIRDIRNAAAHSNCLINDLGMRNRPKGTYSISSINDFLLSIEKISKNTRTKKMRNKTIDCFISLIYGYNDIVMSTEVRYHRFLELIDLFDNRMKRNKEYFKHNDLITSTYNFVYLCILEIQKGII